MKRIASFAAALLMAASVCAALPNMNYTTACAESDIAVPDEWEESEEEAKVRALDHTFDTVMVFKDGTEKKLDIDYEHTLKKNEHSSYTDVYEKSVSRADFEKMLADAGKTYLDVDRIEYRLKFTNSAETNYSDDYMIVAFVTGMAYARNPVNYADKTAETVLQHINTAFVCDPSPLSESYADTYESIEFNFRINYSGAEIYIPTEAHKRAMLTTFEPTLFIKLKDETLIPVNDAEFTENTGSLESCYYTAKFTQDELKKIITDAGKDPADFSRFVGFVDPKYPADSGITSKSVMTNVTLSTGMYFTLKPGYYQNAFSASSTMRGSLDFSKAPFKAGESNEFRGTVRRTVKSEEEGKADSFVDEELTFDKVESFTASIHIGMHGAEIADAEPAVKKGDINGDNTVNVSDIALIAAQVKGIKPLNAEQKKYADLNGDGRIDVSDIIILAKIVKGQK
ncbi:dockerin type I repeat-containing protein [uncultured Ruminococcus sp.]|uniref:dockerin type I repeat-containing protein n=1 Tax=uncultured Ruminococcus sp. TaxID=165186 RepID=UPI0025FAC90A|nr:dockerin type I repeat-containing protein [uncultured Ruminococcus sp.]